MLNPYNRYRLPRRMRRGQLVVLFAVSLVMILSMVAFGVDVGYMMVRRTEAQRAVDAAALAAADELEVPGTTEQKVRDVAHQFLTANGVEPQWLEPGSLVLEFGRWKRDAYSFEPGPFAAANAVRIAMKGGDGLFFGRVLGRDRFSFTTEAIAIGTGGNPPRDVMLVIDCSASMDDDGGAPPQPISAVKEAALVLCDAARKEDHLGLAVYNWTDPDLNNRETGRLEVAMTSDRSALRGIIETLTAGHYASYTNIAGGIRAGGEALRDAARADADRVLIVLTDGKANRVEPPYGVPPEDLPHGAPPENPAGDALESALGWAREMAASEITIHTVSLGASADHALMRNVAAIGNGTHYEITGTVAEYTQQLQEVFRELGEGLGQRSTLVR